MKKLASFFLSAFLLLNTVACGADTSETSEFSFAEVSSTATISTETSTSAIETVEKKEDSVETRAYWVSYLDLQDKLQNHTEKEAKASLDKIVENVMLSGGNTIFLQVRPFGDALYHSEFFPASHIASGTQGKNYSFDVLNYVIEIAHQKDIAVEAWINPFRIQDSTKPPSLSTDNRAYKWLEEGSRNVVKLEKGVYYNPASEEAQELIVSGVREIVENYNVDGIQFDDYFYPTTDESFDEIEYKTYQLDGGGATLSKWRQENVNTLIKTTYSTIKEVSPDVKFGISPMADIEKNYTEQYADVKTWASTEGYVDYLMPQIYFGFEHATAPFQESLESWEKLLEGSSVDLMVGLAVYKIGIEDQWAGDAGKNEWTENNDLLARQIAAAREMDHYSGMGFYRYDSVFAPESSVETAVSEEMKNVKALPNW